MSTQIYIVCDGDNVGQLVGQHSFADQEAELTQISNKIQQANELFSNFAIQNGGRIINCNGDEARICVPAEAAIHIPDLREKYRELTGCSVSVGMGMALSQAEKACICAKHRGKDQIVLYDQSVEEDLHHLAEMPEDEKLNEHYLLGSVHNPDDDVIQSQNTDEVAPIDTTGLNEQLDNVNSDLKSHTLDGQLEKLNEELKTHTLDGQLETINAQMPVAPSAPVEAPVNSNQPINAAPVNSNQPINAAPEVPAQAPAQEEPSNPVSVLQLIAQTLTSVKEHAHYIEGLKTQNPQAYLAVKGIVQAMLALSHEMLSRDSQEAQPQDPNGGGAPDPSQQDDQGPTGPEAQNPAAKKYHREEYPVGTVKGNKVKIERNDGSGTTWITASKGLVSGENGAAAIKTTKQDQLHIGIK